MTPILLNQLRNLISSSLISKLSKRFDETETLLKKTVETSICTVLIGLSNIIENRHIYDKVIESITGSEFYTSLSLENGKLTSINSSFEREGSLPLNLIFSNKKGRISEMISNEIGIKSETAHAVLNLAVMVTFSHFLSEKQKAKNIQPALNDQKKLILSTIPEGIRVILGYSNFECEEEISPSSNPLVTSNFTASLLHKFFKL